MDNDSNKNAKERLLDAAEELFCDKGYEGASIRQLTKAANCNIAAVNYHFGGKDNLYIEVFRRRLIALRDIRIKSIDTAMTADALPATLETLLGAFATAFIEPLLDRSSGRRLIKMMTREMVDQKLPENMFFDEMVKPVVAALYHALITIHPGLDQTKAVMSIHSVIAQLLHLVRIQEMFTHDEKAELPAWNLTDNVNHIVKFSAVAIRSFANENN